jgi:hypothetical protein
MTEAFGLYALAGKATSFLAPLSIGIVTDITDSQQLGILPLIVLFVIGLVLLIWVKPEGDPRMRWRRSGHEGMDCGHPDGAGPACGRGGGRDPANQLFGAHDAPSRQDPMPIGSYAKGCAAGLVELPETGPTWQAMRLSRNRNWGHPKMIAYLEDLSRAAVQIGWRGFTSAISASRAAGR